MATKSNIPADDVLPTLRFFHDVGSLVHVDDPTFGLKDLVIINPQWLADVMARFSFSLFSPLFLLFFLLFLFFFWGGERDKN